MNDAASGEENRFILLELRSNLRKFHLSLVLWATWSSSWWCHKAYLKKVKRNRRFPGGKALRNEEELPLEFPN
jgi:hypothetical protein